MSFFVAIKKDAQYRRYLKIYKSVAEKLDLEAYRAEALNMHSTRPSRGLIGKKVFSPKSITEAVGHDLAYRSRLVEMRERTSIHLSFLSGTISRLHRYILTEYRAEMRGMQNEPTRKAALARITTKGTDLVEDATAFVGMLDMFIKDIDQAKFSTRDMIAVLQLISDSKGRVV